MEDWQNTGTKLIKIQPRNIEQLAYIVFGDTIFEYLLCHRAGTSEPSSCNWESKTAVSGGCSRFTDNSENCLLQWANGRPNKKRTKRLIVSLTGEFAKLMGFWLTKMIARIITSRRQQRHASHGKRKMPSSSWTLIKFLRFSVNRLSFQATANATPRPGIVLGVCFKLPTRPSTFGVISWRLSCLCFVSYQCSRNRTLGKTHTCIRCSASRSGFALCWSWVWAHIYSTVCQ